MTEPCRWCESNRMDLYLAKSEAEFWRRQQGIVWRRWVFFLALLIVTWAGIALHWIWK